MAKAYKCDHCGTLFTDRTAQNQSPIFIAKQICVRYDFCNECQKELEAFVHYKSDKDEPR